MKVITQLLMPSPARRVVASWMFLPLVFAASSLSAQTSSSPLPPLAPAYGEMQPTFWERYGMMVLFFGCLFLTLIGVTIWMALRPKPPVMVAPEVQARKALTELLRQPEEGNVLSEISRTLRRYLIAAFQFPAGELTTREFSAALAGSQKIGTNLAQAVSSFLHECDQRKFSPARSSTPLHAAATALKLVDQAEQRRVLQSAASAPAMVKA